MKCIIFYNPLSHRGNGFWSAKVLSERYPDWEIQYKDMTTVKPEEELRKIPADTKIVFTGGDGTLNLVSNALYDMKLDREVYYFPAGTGNDFLKDLKLSDDVEPLLLNDYIKNLPVVRFGGKSMRFLNGVGSGLDGYCCDMSDRLNKMGKHRSYTLIALTALLGAYKPVNAKATVDGVTKTYKGVWMAPTMFGSFFGGGVNIAPKQSRYNEERTVTNVMVHKCTRLQAIRIFLSVIKGEGYKYPEFIEYRTGHHVKVEFETPNSMQIDGEVFTGVDYYEVDYE